MLINVFFFNMQMACKDQSKAGNMYFLLLSIFSININVMVLFWHKFHVKLNAVMAICHLLFFLLMFSITSKH